MKLAFIVIFLIFSTSVAAQSLEKKIDSLITRANYAEALKLIRSQNTPTDFLKNKEAEALMSSGKLTEADAILVNIKTQDLFTVAITQNNLGYLNLLKGRSDLAQESLEKARDQFKQLGKDNTKEAARCFSNLCLLYWSTGKISQAEENGLIALQLRQSIFGNESEEAAASLNDLGLVYGSTDVDKGLDYYEKVLTIYKKFYGEEHPKIAVAETNIGLMYFNLRLYGDAVVNFENAQAIWKKTYPEGHPNEAICLTNLGRTYTQLKNNKAAFEYYEKALDIYKKTYGEKHPDIAIVYNQTGYIKLEDNKYEDALADFQKALCANSPSFNNLATLKNPDIRNFYNGKVLLFSLRLKAQAFESLHYGKTLKLQDLRFALNTLQSCDSLIDEVRHNSNNENDKIELGSLANEVYEDGVRIAQSISELTIQSKYYKALAFYFAEKSKSAVLQESIADSQAKTFTGIPQDLIDEEQSRKTSITLLSQQLSEKPNAENEKKLRSELFNANLEYGKFIKKLESDFPSYYNLKYSSVTPSISDLQKTILPTQAIVSYFIAEKNKKLYQFVITNRKFRMISRTLPDNFDRSCKGFINSLLFSDFNTFQNSVQLANLLRPNTPHSTKSIVVIPSGKISSLPLEAMPLKKLTKDDYTNSSLFIDRWAISYEFAAGLILQKTKEKNNKKPTGIFLCAPIHFSENQNLNDLPGTEKEVDAIAKLFNDQSKVFTFDKANEATIKSKEVQNYNYLHLATHGIVDASDPAQSKIFLNSSSTEDGNLYCREIYNMNLNSELVVVSACETGLGKFSKGEGLIGLSRALTYAGAKNIIVSFWKVSDESTAELMISFYKHLLNNSDQDFSKAIRQAKLDIIKTGKYASPYYWAPFVLIGK